MMTAEEAFTQSQRYLIFAYGTYYPSGGKKDVEANAETLEDIKQFVLDSYDRYGTRKIEREHIDVLDLQERRWLKDEEISAMEP